ncbi:uncharacterized protein LOC141856499 [Brevipalpus obovatus]|uniref:uncharacterized protein LOC141856499 n=1 Tax=Brevipalpus obovatus TaxID=246614 RepID=UPI003D9E5702
MKIIFHLPNQSCVISLIEIFWPGKLIIHYFYGGFFLLAEMIRKIVITFCAFMLINLIQGSPMVSKNSQIEREEDDDWSDPGMGSSSPSNSSWIRKMMDMFSNRNQSEKSGSFMETMSRHMESLMGMFSNMMGSLGQRGSISRWGKNFGDDKDVEVFGNLKTGPSMQLNMPSTTESTAGENVSTDSIKEGNFDGLRRSFEAYLNQTRETLKNSWTRMQDMLIKQRDKLNGTIHKAIEGMKDRSSTNTGKDLPELTNMTNVMQNITSNQ